MIPQKGMRAAVGLQRWSGHGEGGTTVHIDINRPEPGNCYDATPQDIKQAEADAAYINAALAAWDAHNGLPGQTK